MKKELTFREEARSKLASGVNKLSSAVAVTLGPKGRNVLIQKNFAAPIITKDGVTVAKHVFLEDVVENMGAQLVKEVAARTAKLAGDGTTTATIIANRLIQTGIQAIKDGSDPMLLKKGIDSAAASIVEALKEMAIEVGDDVSKIENVATVSSNGDRELGGLIAQAFSSVGVLGAVDIGSSGTGETKCIIEKGIQFKRGYLSSLFVNREDVGTVEYDNVLVVIIAKRISAFPEIVNVAEKAFSLGKPMLFIVNDIEAQPLQALIMNKVKAGIPLVVVKAPGYGEQQKEQLEDIATFCGASIIGDERGLSLDEPQAKWFGKCGSIKVDKEFTYIRDGHGNEEVIKQRIASIKHQLKEASDFEKEQLLLRLSKLTGGIAVIQVGANSDVEFYEKKDRVDDALHATRAALEEGVLPGGGVALFTLYDSLFSVETSSPLVVTADDQERGALLMLEAVKSPIETLLSNAGENVSSKINELILKRKFPESPNVGIDISTGEIVDMIDAGIIDPVKVTRVAVENAASVAGMILTTECAIYTKDEIKAGQEELFHL